MISIWAYVREDRIGKAIEPLTRQILPLPIFHETQGENNGIQAQDTIWYGYDMLCILSLNFKSLLFSLSIH